MLVVVSVVVLLCIIVFVGMRVMATPTPSAPAATAPAATYNGQQIPAGAPPQGFQKAKELEKEKGQTPGP